jgi:hypothetical protein
VRLTGLRQGCGGPPEPSATPSAQRDGETPVAAHVTGSPHNAASRTIASSARRFADGCSTRRRLQNITHGRHATDHDRFGVFSIETTGPDSAKTQAPNAAACPELCRRKKNVPSAAIGTGSATHRLNDTTSDGRSRIASVTGISN